jgi:type I restriction enzyme S subunit
VIDDLKPYSKMKDSGVPWLGEVPEHWEVQRLRNLADMRVSNVDKHTKDDEQPVRLCNYVDVYKNDYIRPSMSLMRATATEEEIERFRLSEGDVLITKDSEAWNDIGVPALVRESADDLVCGYHLALLRPFRERVAGEFLFRSLQSTGVQYQFHVEANGVTRYGLSHAAIKSVWLPAPPVSEQAAIVRFLDHADRRIRRYIRAKQKLIKLLEEQQQAIIHRAVTRGLDPNVRLKPSGVEWLGEVPEHWGVKPAKWFFREVDERSATGDEELLSVSHLTGVTPRSQKSVTMFMAESYVGHKVCRPGDLVINTMWAWMAALGVARQVGLVSPAYGVYRPRRGSPLIGDYADLLLRTRPYVSEYVCRSTGIQSSRLRLYPEQFLRIPLVCPPEAEQRAILANVASGTAEMAKAIAASLREIQLLHEYRTRLIADVVTGKLDVRDAAARLPPDTEDLEPIDEAEALGDPSEESAADDLDAEQEEAVA